MIVVVTGGRDWSDKSLLYTSLDGLHGRYGVTAVIHGASGHADALSGAWAQERGIMEVGLPYASAYGKTGGSVRNGSMLDVGQALSVATGETLLVVAFPTPASRGTWNCVTKAKQRGLNIRIVEAPKHAGN
jgi:hypothetical protein